MTKLCAQHSPFITMFNFPDVICQPSTWAPSSGWTHCMALKSSLRISAKGFSLLCPLFAGTSLFLFSLLPRSKLHSSLCLHSSMGIAFDGQNVP